MNVIVSILCILFMYLINLLEGLTNILSPHCTIQFESASIAEKTDLNCIKILITIDYSL